MSGCRSILGTSSRITKPYRSKLPNSTISPRKKQQTSRADTDSDLDDDEQLEDLGVTTLLTTDLTLRDVVQALRYILSHTFHPVPSRFPSTASTKLLSFQVNMPPMVTLGHLNAVLESPSTVEREVVELSLRGAVRKIRVERRGALGEALIEAEAYYSLIRKTVSLEEGAKEAFIKFLRENPTAQTVQGRLTEKDADELIRAGFLTAPHTRTSRDTLHNRPEERNTLTSLHHISRQSSGSILATGGPTAIHLSGGTRSPSSSSLPSSTEYRISIPGHGKHMRISGECIDWIKDLLAKTRFGECAESKLRERFEGGGLYGPRWKEFWGVEWEWALGEAIGIGAVEVFETGSVGRGVRALGG